MLNASTVHASDLAITQPQSRQVHQRNGSAPGVGYALVTVAGTCDVSAKAITWEYQLKSDDGSGGETTWQEFSSTAGEPGKFAGQIRIPAGWWQLVVRCRDDQTELASGHLTHVGVGEVFVVAGQSYATNTNDERLNVTDAAQRVSAFDLATGTWRLANDPQPTPDGSDGGSIWPPIGDMLVAELRVPVGFANVAVGGTSSQQWLPDETLFPRLAEVGPKIGRCRAILWQQGESDVISKTPAATYVDNIRTIQTATGQAWVARSQTGQSEAYSVPWLLAKSTHHPTVYNDPEGENRIRGAIDTLTTLPGFKPGPDTDTLQGENRGDINSRRHFSAIGQKRAAELWKNSILKECFSSASTVVTRVGIAETDITPPAGFPMAGYYHERLAEGEIDPLNAKAIVFASDNASGAMVVCDLIGIATDLKNEIRRRASEKTGIPTEHIGISATHTHTAPDYMKELYLYLGQEPQEALRKNYIEKLINGPVDAIVAAHQNAAPVLIESGYVVQNHPVSFNRRSVMRDGSVKTWVSLDDPSHVRVAGPIDPEIGIVSFRDLNGTPRGVLSNFALHLDTVGGSKWSADYPFFIDRVIRQQMGAGVVSIFGTGCCGDINHVDRGSKVRNTADVIGSSLGKTILAGLPALKENSAPQLIVKSSTIHLPLQSADQDEVAWAVSILEKARKKEPVDFLDHVTAHKKVLLDGVRHKEPFVKTADHITWGLSRSLSGIGDHIPVDITVFALGEDVAIVCLPGEVFVDLGLAIKRNSPFKTTLLLELSNQVETIYVPTRAAYAGGSYEVTNSATEPGSGELLVESALKLLKDAAVDLRQSPR